MNVCILDYGANITLKNNAPARGGSNIKGGIVGRILQHLGCISAKFCLRERGLGSPTFDDRT